MVPKDHFKDIKMQMVLPLTDKTLYKKITKPKQNLKHVLMKNMNA